jgi:2-oxoglutarate dehydrogenase E2 component (dihydrolipoamide succinyltransferase)
MAVDIKVPSVGESVSEGTISRWLKPNGASVKANEPVLEIETDKAASEVMAPAAGVLVIGAKEGERVAVGAVVGKIDTAAAPAETKPEPKPGSKAEAKRAEPKPSANSMAVPPKPQPEPVLSPAARQAAADAGVEPSALTGTGRGGRVIKEDVFTFLEAHKSEMQSGPPKTEPRVTAPPPLSPQADGRETRVRMSPIRQRIAERLLQAQQNAAILTTFNEADLSAVLALRVKYKESFQKKHGVGLGFMGFFVKAVVEALRAFPAVNARIDGAEIVYQNFYDIGVAVSTEKGLMVPVLRDADQRSFAQIEKGIAELAAKARDNKITVNDLSGGTFTITNGGVFGSLLSTPILNPPQSGILGMHAIQKRPVVVDDQVVVRPMMYLALSYDHRMIDGREAVSFLVRVKECVESPERLMLEV